MANLSTETADLKKALKACERAVQASTVMKAMGDRAKAALKILLERLEHGVSVEMRAEFAWRFKKTMDQQQLDETTIETLLVDVRSAVSDITTAGIVLSYECKSADVKCRNQEIHEGILH